MLDEALAAPQTVTALLQADRELYARLGERLRAAPPRAVVTIARGSSDHAASYLAYLMTARSGRLVTSLPMSLVTLYQAPVDAEGLLAIAISQSGRSPDLVEPVARFRGSGATTVALVNEERSPLAEVAPSMLLPKKTLVGLAGQNAWHIWTGVALPRASGKYRPSQLRTQNAGPPPEATGRGGGAGGWFWPNGSAKKFACGGTWSCF